jgi:prophage DNA circulation protein
VSLVDKLKEAFGIGQDRDEGPSWATRLKEAAYTSPSGRKLSFVYTDLTTTREKKTSAYQFADASGTYIQDHGAAGRRFPLRVYLAGKDCDVVAKAFEALLFETGQGRLDHPIHGAVDVVPFGDVTRRDDLVTAGNQVVFEVTFFETTGIPYPSAGFDALSAVGAALADYNAAVAAQLEEKLALSTPLDRASVLDRIQAGVDKVTKALDSVAQAQQAINDEFEQAVAIVNGGVDAFGDVLSLGVAMQEMIQAPGRAAALVAARLDAYGSLLDDLVESPWTTPNDFHVADAYASGAVSGSALSVTSNTFSTRTEALEAAAVVLAQFDALTAWRDAGFDALDTGEVSVARLDTGGTYDGISRLVSLAVGYLVEISFTLRQERAVVLDRARNVVELAAELYPGQDLLDYLIETNDFTGSEILEIPRGRRVVYYV